jgi:hypothetical protein
MDDDRRPGTLIYTAIKGVAKLLTKDLPIATAA